MNNNIGYIFYKDLYNITPKGIKSDGEKIKNLLNTKIPNSPAIVGEQHFSLFTTYPGLTFGVGLSHGVKDDNDDFKIGFTFDHTTGLPVIPGSTVKGLLRSAFPGVSSNKKHQFVKAGWIHALIKGFSDEDFFEKTYEPLLHNFSSIDIDAILAIEQEIFEGFKDDKTLGIYKRDIFHDAIIGTEHEKFLGIDYITPHIPSPLKNPIPIKFLKILPEIKIIFQFDLKDGILSTEEKQKLFEKIILSIGIGAKTNVGYGQFRKNQSIVGQSQQSNSGSSTTKPSFTTTQQPEIVLPKPKPFDRLNNGDKVTGTVTDNSNGELLFKVDIEGEYRVKPFKYGSCEDYKVGRKAILEVANKQKEKGIWMLTVRYPKFLKE
jgi:CRISPR-associated protein Cmr6